MDLTDSDTIKHILAKHKLEPTRSLGQNFLVCSEAVEATMLSLSKAKHITELGPGIGALTQALSSSDFKVKAIERDNNMVKILKTTLTPKQRAQVEVINGDLKDIDWTWTDNYQLVGNIPYNLSGLIIRRLTKLDPQPTQAILLVQKEVGERLTAQASDMSLLTLAVNLWGKAEKIINVPKNCFWPAPKVDSALILLKPTANNELSLGEREAVMEVAKKFFQNKRKQVGGTMRRVFTLDEAAIDSICKKADIEPMMRPQEISADKWVELASHMK